MFLPVLLFACNNKTKGFTDDAYKEDVITGVGFADVVKMAQDSNKYIWCCIGGGADCPHTIMHLNNMKIAGVFDRYKDKYLFFVADLDIHENKRLHYIFRIKSIPNSYIFSPEGKLLSTSKVYNFRSDIVNHVEDELKKALSGKEQILNFSEYPEYYSVGKRLYDYFDTLMDMAYILDEQDDDTLLDSVANVLNSVNEGDRKIYYYYLKSRLGMRTNNQDMISENADSVYTMINKASNSLYYKKLLDEVKVHSKLYTESLSDCAVMRLKESRMDFGKLTYHVLSEFETYVYNDGTKPLIIYKVSSSCDCIKVDYPKKPIMPRDSALVKISIKPNFKGNMFKTAYFSNSSPDNLLELVMVAEI